MAAAQLQAAGAEKECRANLFKSTAALTMHTYCNLLHSKSEERLSSGMCVHLAPCVGLHLAPQLESKNPEPPWLPLAGPDANGLRQQCRSVIPGFSLPSHHVSKSIRWCPPSSRPTVLVALFGTVAPACCSHKWQLPGWHMCIGGMKPLFSSEPSSAVVEAQLT